MSDNRYAFLVEWLDPNAQIVWKFQLLYWDKDCSCELYDIKNRRTFLKRCPAPHVKLQNLYLGAVVTLHARQLKILEYSDTFTQKTLSTSRQKCAPASVDEGTRGRSGSAEVVLRGWCTLHTEQYPSAAAAPRCTAPRLFGTCGVGGVPPPYGCSRCETVGGRGQLLRDRCSGRGAFTTTSATTTPNANPG
jgi:hypothetical protein